MKNRRNFTSLLLAGAMLVWAGVPATTVAQDDGPQTNEATAGFLADLTRQVEENPDQAAEIVRSALQSRLDEIQQTPGLATDIVLAVIAGLPDSHRTGNVIGDILFASSGVLNGLPVDQSNVASDVIQSVLETLSEDLALAVKNQALQGPQGGLRNRSEYIFTVPPDGGGAIASPLAAEKVTICHKGRNTLTISANALDAHLRHGDTIGACEVTPSN